MTARFLKRNDAWLLRVENDEEPAAGSVVVVPKRNGDTSTVTITRVVQEADAGAWLCEFRNGGVAVAEAKQHAPTAEQQHAVDLFLGGGSLAIEAGAGTGKTSTLVMLALAAPDRRVQYVAFNKPIVRDASGKFPGNVNCSTAHALAMRAVGVSYKSRLDNARRMKSVELAKVLRTEEIRVINWAGEEKRLSATFLAGHVVNALERFCQSADDAPTYRHVPRVENLDAPPTAERPASYPVNDAVARALEPVMRRAWQDICRYEGVLPFKHSYYLKLWQLSRPVINADVILFDEAQDASPVMVDVVAQQQQRGAQVVWVGDSQQQIYSFTGAVNALANVPSDQRAFLTQSFRFGQAIADVANLALRSLRADLALTGFDRIDSTVERLSSPAAFLTRTNAEAIRRVLGELAAGRRPHLVGGGSDVAAFARGARDLQAGGRSDHPDLACFDSWGDVQRYVEEDEQGGDLKLLVDLIDEFGVERILAATDPQQQVPEDRADIVVSTAHKSKGREWESVKLGGDFKDEPQGEELRLLYVAVTRAKRRLDVTNVGWFDRAASPQTSTTEGSHA